MPSAIPHIVTVYSASYVPWMWLVWLGMLLLLHMGNPGGIKDGFVSLFSPLDRRYADNTQWGMVIMEFLYCIMVLAMGIYLFWFARQPFSMLRYSCIIGLIMTALLIKGLLIHLIAYVFSWGKMAKIVEQHYASTRLALSVVSMALLLPATVFPMETAWRIMLLLLIAVYWIVALLKMVRWQLHGALSLLCIVLYWTTIEILPIIGFVYAIPQLL